MAQDSYKHISIEDDEEVFVVGAAACAPQVADSGISACEAAQNAAGETAQGVAQNAAQEESEFASNQAICEDADETYCADASSVHAQSRPDFARSAHDKAGDELNFTADDLHSEPMSLLQKIIIVAAIVGVIALVAYLVL